MPRFGRNWRVRHGPDGCGYLVNVQSSCSVCQGIPDNKKS